MHKIVSYLASLLLALALLAMPATVAAQPTPAGAPSILPPEGRHYGRTYGEWGAAFWQWLGPQLAADEATCGGPSPTPGVWFGGGGPVGGEPITLACTLPAETALFFPILTAECSEAEGNGTTEAELRACAIELVDEITVAEVTIDGVAVPVIPRYRAQSPLFTFTFPAGLTTPEGGAVPPGPTRAVADGYWIMLAPLSVGKHTISFHAVISPTDAEPISTTFTVEITVTQAPATPGMPNTGAGGSAPRAWGAVWPLVGWGLVVGLGLSAGALRRSQGTRRAT